MRVYRYKCPECGSTDSQTLNTFYMKCFGWGHIFESKSAEIVVVPVPSTKK